MDVIVNARKDPHYLQGSMLGYYEQNSFEEPGFLPCARSVLCFTTAAIRSFGHFEKLGLLNCRRIATWHLLAANSKSVGNFQPSIEYSL